MRILVIEDDPVLHHILSKRLKEEGHSVDDCYDGEAGFDYADAMQYDCIVLDLMLPKRDGLSLLRDLRSRGNASPVLILTARDAIDDRVAGLDAGADDYLVKPFALEELLARVRALLRRDAGRADNCYRLADLTVDCDARTARRGDVQITLSSKEFSILEYLIRNQGVVLSRDKIEQHIWNYDYAGGSNVVDVYIRYLRRKIDDGFSPKLIHTVRGAGFVLREQP